jgi:hypothetical protein
MQTASGIRSSTASIILRPDVVAAQASTDNYVCNREYFVKSDKISGQANKKKRIKKK